MKELKIYKQKDIEEMGYEIRNEIIEHVDIVMYKNIKNNCYLEKKWTGEYLYVESNNTENIGEMLRFLVEFLKSDKEKGLRSSEIKNISCRIVLDRNYRIIGFGHFLLDMFVFEKDFLKIKGRV